MNEARRPHYQRNFALGIISGVLVNFGLAFIDPFTVLPVFITRLGGSGAIVGLAAATYAAGWFLPQVFVAPFVEVRRRVLSIYTVASVVRVSAYAALITAVFTIDPSRPGLILLAVICLFGLANVTAGITGVPFLEITSKAFAVTDRGRFFGIRRLLGGALGIFAGMVVAVVLGRGGGSPWSTGPIFEAVRGAATAVGFVGRPFPHNYGLLFLCGAVLAASGYAAFAMIKEPDGEVAPRRRAIREIFAAGGSLLRSHGNYRLFFAVRVFWQLTAMSFPFYATYAYTRLGLGEAVVGLFVSLWVGSGVVSNYMWGRLGDARGNRLVLAATAAISVVPPVAMLAVTRNDVDPAGQVSALVFAVMASTFVVNGIARSGRFISNMTYLLEFVPQQGRPVYVGFMNSISFPLMLSPVLGGIIVEVFSFEVLFVVAAVAAVVNAFLSWRLEEPRTKTAVVAAQDVS